MSVYIVILPSCGQKTQTTDKQLSHKDSLVTMKNVDIVVYEIAIPPRDTFDIFPETVLTIKRDSIKPTFLKFQSGGTETNIALIDSAYANNYKNIWDSPDAKRLDFGFSESGLLEISNLRKGTYLIRYSSCNIGGNYKLILAE